MYFSVSADTELKMSSLATPIIGDVNVLRYLSILFPKIFPSIEDFTMDHLLDLCYMMQKCTDKNKEVIGKKLFSQYNNWICNKQFTIVDIAVYNVVKQMNFIPKYVPSDWFTKYEQLLK